MHIQSLATLNPDLLRGWTKQPRQARGRVVILVVSVMMGLAATLLR